MKLLHFTDVDPSSHTGRRNRLCVGLQPGLGDGSWVYRSHKALGFFLTGTWSGVAA